MSYKPAFSIDGQSLAVPTVRQSSLPEPSVTYELNEYKRKLEKRDSDFKRKERELGACQAELTRLRKDNQSQSTEIVSLIDRNQQLQQSLNNARDTMSDLQNKLKDIADSDQSSEQLKKLEAALSKANRQVQILSEKKESLDSRPTTNIQLEEKLVLLQSLLNASKLSEDRLKTDITTLQLAFENLEEQNKRSANETDDLRKRISNTQNLSGLHNAELEKKQFLINDGDKIRSHLKNEIEKLKSSLLIRNETNLSLRGQLEDLNDNQQTNASDEEKKIKKMELENHQQQQIIQDLNKIIAKHTNSLHDIGDENKILHERMGKLSESVNTHDDSVLQHQVYIYTYV
jgi:chromosome segregation ATPase